MPNLENVEYCVLLRTIARYADVFDRAHGHMGGLFERQELSHDEINALLDKLETVDDKA